MGTSVSIHDTHTLLRTSCVAAVLVLLGQKALFGTVVQDRAVVRSLTMKLVSNIKLASHGRIKRADHNAATYIPVMMAIISCPYSITL